MSHREIQREVEAAISHGIEEYTARELAADATAHPAVSGSVDAETAAGVIDFMQANREAVAATVTDELLPQLNTAPAASSSGGKRVAADGGSIVSAETRDTVYLSLSIINGFQVGRYISGEATQLQGAFAAVALVLLLTVWFGLKYDISIETSSDG